MSTHTFNQGSTFCICRFIAIFLYYRLHYLTLLYSIPINTRAYGLVAVLQHVNKFSTQLAGDLLFSEIVSPYSFYSLSLLFAFLLF